MKHFKSLLHPYIYLSLVIASSYSRLAFSGTTEAVWGGTCSFQRHNAAFEFRSVSGDITNDDMVFHINSKAIDIPKAWYHPSNIYLDEINNLCSQGILAFEHDGNYVIAIVKDGRPNLNSIIFLYYDASKGQLIDFIDPKINIKHSSDDDSYPIIMKSIKGKYYLRGIDEVIQHSKDRDSNIFLDGWFELKIINRKLIIIDKSIKATIN